MRKGGGKQKGAQFERDICAKLSRFILPDSDETLFWRSAMSGGRATQQFKRGIKNKTQLGDITCVHEAGLWLTEYFYIECKFYKDLDIASGLLFGKGMLAKFWNETCNAADNHDKLPMLIARQNNVKTLIIFSKGGTDQMATFGYDVQTPRVVISHALGEANAHVCFFDDVFAMKRKRRK